ARLARRGFEIVEGPHGRAIDHLAVEEIGTAGAQDPAARPIDRHALAHRAAEKLVDRYAERLAADVEAGIHEGSDGGGRRPAGGRPRAGVKRGVKAGDGARVLANERSAEALNQGGHALAAALVELGPARDALIGGDLQERISVPPAVGVEVL